MQEKQKTMEELVKESVNLSEKKPSKKTATDKMIANLEVTEKKGSREHVKNKTFLTKPIKGQTRKQFKKQLMNKMKLPTNKNRFGINDEDIILEREK